MALKCFELVESNVDDYERSIGILVLLFGRDVPINEYFLDKATLYLQRGEPSQVQSSRKQDIDLTKDFKYIATSIQTQYHLDIVESDMHFWKFIDLIEGLNDTLINHIRDVRNAELKDFKDIKQRKKIIEAKNHYALDNKIIIKPKTLKELYEELERG